MERLRTYADMYEDKFLTKFGKYRPKVEELKFENQDYVDVNLIAKVCDISIEHKLLFHSGESDYENRKITVNNTDVSTRQRFTIGHEIGHIILEHSGVSYRTDVKEKYSTLIEKIKETHANQFAAELLMPKKLVSENLLCVLKKQGYSIEDKLSQEDVDVIVRELALKMQVSDTAMDFRIHNLRIFREFSPM